MEEREDSPQLELLAKIHNQLVDLKRVIVEIELAKPGTPDTLKSKLSEIIGSDEQLTGDRTGSPEVKHQKVIAPTDTGITPGEDRK